MMQGGKTMRRSFGWSVIAILAILLAPLAGMFGVPAHTAHAEPDAPAQPAATYDSEIILLTSAGQIRVDDPYVATGTKSAEWNSGSDTGYTRVAAGDFNGDGDAEIVAAKGTIIKVFDPVVQPNSQPVSFEVNLGTGRTVQLLVTGDFDGDGKAEFAVVHVDSGTNIQATLRVYDGGANATAGQWTLFNSAQYGMMWQDMAAADFNGDNTDELVLARNPSLQDKLVMIWKVNTWSVLAQGYYDFPWLAAVGGNFSTSRAGDELFLTRGGVQAYFPSALFFQTSGTSFMDMVSNIDNKFYPYFASIAAGDLNGDGDDEVVMLRDPRAASVALMMLNPLGASVGSDNEFKQAIGYSATAWRSVRLGDVDGDGKAEPVVLRADRYRIYTQPEINDIFTDVTGSFYTTGETDNLPVMAIANVDGPGITLGPVLSVTPTNLSFSMEYRAISPTKTVNITNAGTADVISWQATAVDSPAWLKLSATSGTTPATLGVSVDTSVIGPGTYSGKIRITATSPSGVQASPQDITVSVTITGVTMVVNPKLVEFTIGYGDTVAAKQVTVASQGGSAPFSWHAVVQGGSDWLVVSPTSGTTPTTVNVSVNSRVKTPGGPYFGSIMFVTDDPNVADPIQYVTVRLTVSDSGLVVTPSAVTIWQKIGQPRVQQTVSIERPGIPTSWAAAAVPVEGFSELQAALAAGRFEVTDAGLKIEGLDALTPVDSWLSFTPAAGTTPSTMTLSAKDYTPGTYHAIITVIAGDSSVPNRTRQINVTVHLVNNFYTSFVPLTLK